jgi:hypothetical protein
MNDLQGETVVIIPPNKQLFTVGEIPKLLAAAKWPHKEGRSVSYLVLQPQGTVRGRMLEDAEQDMLNAIWAAQDLQQPVFPLPESDWQRYADAFELAREKPEWSIVPCWSSDAINQGMLRAAAEEQFRRRMLDAIANGQITVRDPLTHMAVTGPDTKSGHDGLLVSRDDFSHFARDAMLNVHDGQAELELPAAVSRVDTDPSQTNTALRPPTPSRNAIGREIEAAIARIQSSDTHAIINQHTVMAELVKRVGIAGSCIIEAVDAGLGVLWKGTDGKNHKLTKDTLKKRLQRRR